MGFGRDKVGNNGKLLVLRIKNKDANDIQLVPNKFEVSEKDANNKWVARPQMEESVSGSIVSVTFGEKEFEGTPYKLVKIRLEDKKANESYLLDLRYTNLSRNLFNSIINLKNTQGININHYAKTSKTDGKQYANVALWQGDNMIKGKFSLAQLPKPDEITDKKKVVVKRDYSEVDAFFEAELKAWWASVSGGTPAAEADESVKESAPESGENVPF